MDEAHCISYRDTGFFSQLICDYLDQKPETQKFYHRFPTLENFRAQIEEKSSFPTENRKLLTEALRSQYQGLEKSGKNLVATYANIDALRDQNTFTVVTGHQLNLFSGPIYFIYKIVSTINLCRELKTKYPEYNFVPVYWMATEDHDFEEINHTYFKGEKISWNRPDGGPVGRFSTKGIESVVEELVHKLGPGEHAKKIGEQIRSSYLDNETLAEATRQLVHGWFGEDGLVIVDGDDASLKGLMIPYFQKELHEQSSFAWVNDNSVELSKTYFNQVNPREINLFYIQDGLRERIVKEGDRWEVLNTDISFGEAELKAELESKPECFSPNVILRPLYQEVILPNLGYIGGGGELAYWLQLKSMFEGFGVSFPMLILRNSVLHIGEKEDRKRRSMELEIPQLFQPLEKLKKKFVVEHAPMDTGLLPYEKKLEEMFNDLEEVAHLTDRSMLGAVNAQRQKQLNGLDKLRKKLIRAEKRRQSVDMERLERLKDKLFPNGGLQERHKNISEFYQEYGDDFIRTLKEELDPLDFRFRILGA